MIRHYFRMSCFCLGLLVGIQIPGFLDQFAKRVEAQLHQAETSLQGFRQTAGRHFSGDLDALVQHYRQSQDKVFREDANSIQLLVSEQKHLANEWKIVQQGQFALLWHLLVMPPVPLLQATLQQYSYIVLLNPAALVWGIGVAILFAAWLDMLITLLLRGIGIFRHSPKSTQPPSPPPPPW